jgi:hypothetical protein
MFLLRCLFWLGLVFFQIAQREGADPSGFLNPAAASQTSSLGQKAAKAAARHCQAPPGACVALAAAAGKFTKIGAWSPSRDTLTGRDRTTARRQRD